MMRHLILPLWYKENHRSQIFLIFIYPLIMENQFPKPAPKYKKGCNQQMICPSHNCDNNLIQFKTFIETPWDEQKAHWKCSKGQSFNPFPFEQKQNRMTAGVCTEKMSILIWTAKGQRYQNASLKNKNKRETSQKCELYTSWRR